MISNLSEDTLEGAPEYLKKDAIRWSSAAQLYDELQRNESGGHQKESHFSTHHRVFKKKKCRSQYHSPERLSPGHRRLSHNHLFGGSLMEMTAHLNGYVL
ncbi:unnamed protein product [Caenorhabditis sp. 36 PRJEB53466]|nr:unnamed protein product [Caenorhabditis sp. 36 PRJEB53466]